jgi:hypothetical protein
MREQLKWYDDKADNSPWLDALPSYASGPLVKAIASNTSRRSRSRLISMQRNRG